MKNRQILLPVLTAGLVLGTAWAVRGKFGHEQGAAWAGAIGAFSIILLAGRKDWYNKAFNIALASAFGWGISGVMSYGVIVGYGRGTDFLNVFYGLLMLFLLGVLYGFLGGGFFGLALLDSRADKIKWHSLLAEIVAFGLLTYAVLINQLEWFMTPPRSEMWAACLGASIALAWYMARNRYRGAMKVAVWSALGAGCGFAFGNFLQVMGNAAGIDFNFWNVMEYSIGFFGGVGMAYGTFTSSWPASDEMPPRASQLMAILFVAWFVPFVVWEQSFVTDRFDFILESGRSASMIFYFKLIAVVAILGVAIVAVIRHYPPSGRFIENPSGRIKAFFVLYSVLYIFLSFLVTGILVHPPEQYLYIMNLLLILFLLSRTNPGFEVREDKPATWLAMAAISITIIALLTVIAINSHEGMHGSHLRFGNP